MNQAERRQLATEVIVECYRDVMATRGTNDDPVVLYELGLAASSLITQVAASFDLDEAEVQHALANYA